MRKREFLSIMDKVKNRIESKANGGYTCLNISHYFFDTDILKKYQKQFDLENYNFTEIDYLAYYTNHNERDEAIKLIRIAAIELFEIIALENKWYTK